MTLQPAPSARGAPGEEVGRGEATDGEKKEREERGVRAPCPSPLAPPSLALPLLSHARALSSSPEHPPPGHTYALYSEAPSTAAGVHVFGAGGALPVAGRATLVRVVSSGSAAERAAAGGPVGAGAAPAASLPAPADGTPKKDKKKRREREREEEAGRAARKRAKEAAGA